MTTHIAGARFFIGYTNYRRTTPKGARALYSPASGITIDVVNPNGKTIISATAMTEDSTGEYSYEFQSSTDTTNDQGFIGEYDVTFTIDDGAAGTSRDYDSFRLEGAPSN